MGRQRQPGEQAIGPGEKFIRGVGTPADLRDADTEGHRIIRNSAPDEAIGPGEKLIRRVAEPDDLRSGDTEGHLRLRRPSEGGE